MKRIMRVCLIFLSLTLVIGCGPVKLSDKYDKEKLKSSVELIINDLNEEKYEDIINMGSENLKYQLTLDKLKDAWQGISRNLGNYKEISKVDFTEKNGNAVVLTIAKYEKREVQFTISFNTKMEMEGIYIR